MTQDDLVTIYCDGACSGNPGPGGWGVVLLFGKHKKELYGYEQSSTNNRMELTAAIMGVAAVKKPMKIAVYTDSMYLRRGITEWIKKWKHNNWNNGKVKNKDLWEHLDSLCLMHKITWHWVAGHSGDYYNELADSLARRAILLQK